MIDDRDQTVRRFVEVMVEAGGEAGIASTTADAVDSIAAVAVASGRLLYEPFELAEATGVVPRLREQGIEVVEVRDAGRQIGELEVGLTGAPLAIAETGTLLVGGRPGGWGLASVLPLAHIVLLDAKNIHADLSTAFALYRRRFEAGERDWVWISGPSKTADIGKIIVKGVHGPNALHVVILR